MLEFVCILPPPLGHIGLVIGKTKTKEGEISKTNHFHQGQSVHVETKGNLL